MNQKLSTRDIDRIIGMAWEYRAPFAVIEHQFGLPEREVIRLMKTELNGSSFRMWRRRVGSGISSKHLL